MKPLLLYVFLSVILLSKVATAGTLGDSDDYVNDDDEETDEGDDDDGGNSDVRANIISQSQTVTVKPGANVTLPCVVDEPDADIVEWFFGDVRIFMDYVKMVNNSHLSSEEGVLHITFATAKEAGNYSCVLVNSGETLHHFVHVKAPAHIESFSVSRDNPANTHHHIVWMKGSKQNISCIAVGYPKPEVTISHVWLHRKHKSNEVQVLHGNPVIIDPVERRHAGKYSCEAKNDQYTTNKGLQVEVEYPPEIHVRREYVSTSEGVETTLMCRVVAHPTATVSWKKNDEPVRMGAALSDRVDDRIDGSHYSLIIRRTEQSDFGHYTCNAANGHGTASKSIRVSGEPSRPIIDNMSFDGEDPVATWKIQSLAPVQEFKVQYKKQQENDWEDIDLEIEESSRENGDIYIAKHKFDHLDEGTYRIRGLAKNSYGWSQTSEEKAVPGKKERSKPWADNSYSHLESVKAGAGEIAQMRISVILLLSILSAHLLH